MKATNALIFGLATQLIVKLLDLPDLLELVREIGRLWITNQVANGRDHVFRMGQKLLASSVWVIALLKHSTRRFDCLRNRGEEFCDLLLPRLTRLGECAAQAEQLLADAEYGVDDRAHAGAIACPPGGALRRNCLLGGCLLLATAHGIRSSWRGQQVPMDVRGQLVTGVVMEVSTRSTIPRGRRTRSVVFHFSSLELAVFQPFVVAIRQHQSAPRLERRSEGLSAKVPPRALIGASLASFAHDGTRPQRRATSCRGCRRASTSVVGVILSGLGIRLPQVPIRQAT